MGGQPAHRIAAEAPARSIPRQHDLAPCTTCHIWHCLACGCAPASVQRAIAWPRQLRRPCWHWSALIRAVVPRAGRLVRVVVMLRVLGGGQERPYRPIGCEPETKRPVAELGGHRVWVVTQF